MPRRTREDLRNALDNQRAINAIMQLLLSGKPLKAILDEALEIIFSVAWLKVAPKGAVFMSDAPTGDLLLVSEHHLSTELRSLCARIALGQCLCGRAALTKQTQFASCVDHRHDISFDGMGPHGHYNVPILDKDSNVLGVLVLYLAHGHVQKDTEVEFLSIVAQTLASIIERKRTEEARDSLARIVQESACEIYELDAETHTFLSVNKAALDNLGYSRSEMLKMTPADIEVKLTHERILAVLDPLVRGEKTNERFETVHRRKDGSLYDVDVNVQVIRSGDKLTFAAIVNDITEQKRLTKLLETTVNNFPGGISVMDRDLKLALANSQFYEVLDLPQEKFPLGSAFEDIIRYNAERGDYGPGDVDDQVAVRVALASKFDPHRFERIRPDGTILEINGQPIKGGGFISTYIDITQRKNAERDAIQAQERLLNAIETINEGFVLFDADDRLVLCNNHYKEIYGLSKDLLVPGARFEEIVRISAERGQYAEAIGRVDEWVSERIASHKSQDSRLFEQRLGDGRWLLVAERRTPDGGSVGIRVDITNQKLTEEKLRDYQQHLEELVTQRTIQIEQQAGRLAEALEREKEVNETQRQFVSIATHEFRTPLAVIDGAAQRIGRRAAKMTPEEIAERAEKIRSAIQQMIGLMESTLAIEKSEQLKAPARAEKCDIRAIIESCCEQQIFMAPDYRIAIDMDDIPDSIEADPAAIESVISNLLSNAIKYSPNSQDVAIAARRMGERLEIAVSDRGLGIDEDDMPKLFARYFRAKTSTGIPGTGIGLNLAKMIAEQHDGEIHAESRKGEGSTFVFRLPIRAALSSAVDRSAAN